MTQQETLKDAMQKLNIDRAGLAGLLGVSLSGINHWLAPSDANVYREMPETARRLIAFELAVRGLGLMPRAVTLAPPRKAGRPSKPKQ